MSTVRLPLSNGKFTLIDEADFDFASKFNWNCYWHRKTWRVSRSYRENGKSKTVYLHRELIGDIPKGATIVHKNGDALDNRRENIKVVPYRFWKETRAEAGRISRNEHGVPMARIPTDNGDGTATVPLTKGMVSIIDSSDIELVSVAAWHASRSGNAFYARTSTAGYLKGIQLHRFILSPLPGLQIDHINGDTLDNRRSNLRVVTGSENMKAWARRHFG